MGKTYSIPGVEIFAAGTHRGQPYTRRDLAQIVANFEKFSSPRARKVMLRVPLVIGHEEDQEYLKRTDLPAAGWATRMWLDGDVLKADFDHVPKQIAELLKDKAFRTTSLEIYDAPPDGIPGKGPMARRTAALGAEIPEVKGLAEIPDPVPSGDAPSFDRATGRHLSFRERVPLPGGGGFAVFSELSRMADKTPRPARHGTPARRAGVRRFAGGPQPGRPGIDRPRNGPLAGEMVTYQGGASRRSLGPTAGAERTHTDLEAGPGLDPISFHNSHLRDKSGRQFDHAEGASMREATCRKLAEFGMQPDGMDGYADGQLEELLQLLMAQKGQGQGGPPSPMESDEEDQWPLPKDEPERQQFRERAKKYLERAKKYAAKYGEIGPDEGEDEDEDDKGAKGGKDALGEFDKIPTGEAMKLSEVRSEVAALRKFREEVEAADKKRGVDALIDRLGREGRLPPAQRESVRQRLLRADCKAVVGKFSEDGRDVPATEFELQVRELERAPSLFSEKFRSGGGSTQAEQDDESAQVEEHYECFSERFEQYGVKKEDYVGAFRAARKAQKGLTANEFIGR